MEHSPVGLALVGLDGRWLRVNDALATLVGRSPAELLAGTFQDITHPEDLDADLSHVQALIAGSSDSYQMDKRYLHADGRVVWVSLHVAMVRDEDGKPLHFVSHITDITERRKLADLLTGQARTDPLTGWPTAAPGKSTYSTAWTRSSTAATHWRLP